MACHEGIKKAVRFIRNHFREPLTLDQVAMESGMSKYHFARVFKVSTGMTFKEYHNRRRIEEAKALLCNRTMRVTDVCYEVGFNDISYFDRVFRRLVGVNPTSYKRRPETTSSDFSSPAKEKGNFVQIKGNIIQAFQK
ncbi:MAG: helix-turn-helix transcriptional regulator [Deltaproteobacteria bacterium]|nr:helix-turn-helix transcriptional regulator [Deltaproteobacteria bacterium]MBW2018178.1 helix-turn-helix transcriptional regulator [Deltaproteobacteria bacterium]MBW2129422.1 helix-turn-helix transcriptional regulator [Deltaproteobacteria bacterium]MBW2302951.1 helix-turn-helix transcriptional regulator [Deltaproteobacteria bacterium]